MAFGSVTLVPGVNSERTPLLLRAGIAISSLIRFRDSLVQKLGGWMKLYPFTVSGVPRDLHAWEDLDEADHLSVGTTGTGTKLVVITNGSLQDITPQTLTSNFVPNFSTSASSPVINIIDPNIANVTIDDAVFFNVPVSIGGLILFGIYPITEITGTDSYQITASENAITTEANPTATNASTASGNNTLNFATTPSWLTNNATLIADLTTPSAIPVGTVVTGSTGTTVTMSNNAAGAGVGNGDEIVFYSIPLFITTNGSSLVEVKLVGHGLAEGETIVFQIATTGNGVTLGGAYEVASVTDANTFNIVANTQATSSGSFPMNGGDVQLIYYIALGPPPAGSGFGLGGFGSGGFGTGTGTSSQTGTEITALDWTTDNWGQDLVACPENGGIYVWIPDSGFQNAQLLSSDPATPIFNAGIFVSTTAEILVAYGSSVAEAIGIQQQPLLVQWSDAGNYNTWTPTAENEAGNYPLSNGSRIVAGIAAPNQNLLWTDLDLWAMNYIGPPDVFGFNKIGAGLGAVSSHAIQSLRGSIFWMAPTNFASYTSNGANVIPCPIWDAIFQNLNTGINPVTGLPYTNNIRAMPNTPYNEVGWLFPSINSTSGENDSYVKMNITEPGAPWDYCIGGFSRSAWIDESVLGMPIGASPNGYVYQHEVSPDADGAPLVPSFTTGFFYLAEGEEYVFVDQVIPDFKWSTFPGGPSAQIQISFNVVNFPGDTPTVFGPYTVTSATEFISVRFRGRLMSVTITSNDIGSFWRIGSIKYRYNPAGRR